MNMNDGSANEENFFSPTVIVFYSNQVTIQSITKQVGASIFFLQYCDNGHTAKYKQNVIKTFLNSFSFFQYLRNPKTTSSILGIPLLQQEKVPRRYPHPKPMVTNHKPENDPAI